MPVATITAKGQLTIPKSVRDALHLHPGDKVSIKIIDGKAELTPKTLGLDELLQRLAEVRAKASGALSLEEIRAARDESWGVRWDRFEDRSGGQRRQKPGK